MTEVELRSKLLRVSVRNQEDREVATISFNLFLISVGPYHHNFLLQYPNRVAGRISLDARMSRLVDLTVATDSVEVALLREHPGETFHFSFRTFVHNKVN